MTESAHSEHNAADLPATDPTTTPDQAQQAASPPARLKSAQQSIVIERPLADVFALGRDLVKRCQWQRGTLDGQLVDPDVVELGARCTETRKTAGGATERWELEVVAFEPDGLLVIQATCEGAQMVERHVFDSDPSGVGRTRYTISVEASGSRLTTADLQRQIVDNLIHFRDCIEHPEPIAYDVRSDAARLRRR